MMNRAVLIRTILVVALMAAGGCGAGDVGNNGSANLDEGGVNGANNGTNGGGANGTNDAFVPETEEFLVRRVASTDDYVFVPNASDEGNTVARIDGRNLSVQPLPVGLRPTEVAAAEVEGVGAIAYVLSEGAPTVAIIRADRPSNKPSDLVHLMEVPREVNTLAAAPGGRHTLAYIDPDKPLSDEASVASLQTMALVRLGDEAAEDAVFDLSVTRLIRDIEFTDDGSEAFIVGREGVNRVDLAGIDSDTFIAPLDLQLSDDVFPPTDLEVEISGDGSFLVVRSSAFEGIAIYELEEQGVGARRLVSLSDIPTDIDLFTRDGARSVIATVRGEEVIAVIDVDAALATPPEDKVDATLVSVEGASAGLATLTPDQETVLLYSTLQLLPLLAVYDLSGDMLRTYPLRNQIRSVAVSNDSETAVIVHTPQTAATDDGGAQKTFFQRNQGLTLFDVATGYRRPVVLDAEPSDLLMTATDDGGDVVFVMLASDERTRRGIMRLDLQTYRSDFVSLPRAPTQIGVVAGNVFVAQDDEQGRITFFDIETMSQRTVSGYELNAGID